MVFILYMFFVRKSHGDTMQLNEWACLQSNPGTPPGGRGDWEPAGSWLAAKRPLGGRGKLRWLHLYGENKCSNYILHYNLFPCCYLSA